MANRPNLQLIPNVPCVIRFPFAADGGGVSPLWSGPSKQGPGNRHTWGVEVGTGQTQYPPGDFALWGSDSLRALIDAAHPLKDTWVQLAHLLVGTKHTWEAHVWDPDRKSWSKVPDPGPLPAPGPEGAASSPPAGAVAPPPVAAPAPAPAPSPERRPATGPVPDAAGRTAYDLARAGEVFLRLAHEGFARAGVPITVDAVQAWACTLLIQASRMGLPMPWEGLAGSPPGAADNGEPDDGPPVEDGDPGADDALPF